MLKSKNVLSLMALIAILGACADSPTQPSPQFTETDTTSTTCKGITLNGNTCP